MYERSIDAARSGRYEESVENLDKIIQCYPDNVEVWTDRGVWLSKLDRLEEAMESFEKALQIDPDDERAIKLRTALGEVLEK